MLTETIIRTLKETKQDNPKHILPRTVLKAVADENGDFISSDVTAQDINQLHGKTLMTANAQTLTDAQKAQARSNINAAAPDGFYGNSGGVYQYSTNFLGKNNPTAVKDLVFRPTASAMSGTAWSADSIGGDTATIERIKGKTLVWNQLVGADTTEVPTVSGNKYLLKIDGEFSVITSAGQAIAVTGGTDMVIDLTRMYVTNVPSTVEEFRAMFPLDYYDYNEGELISFNGTLLQTTGFNQLDSEGHIHVIGGMTYRIEGAYTSLVDSAGNAVTVTDNEFTPAQNDTYTMVGGSCVHLKWSGVRDGDTEDYWQRQLALPIAQYFPDGMKSVGTAYDELTKDRAIKRVKEVDAKTANWVYSLAYTVPLFIFSVTDKALGQRNIFSGKYLTSPAVSSFEQVPDKCIFSFNIGTNKYIAVHDESYTNVASFTADLFGQIAYELAEPIETPISPELNLTYKVDDFGTEMLLPENTATPTTTPMDADIVYQLDYEAQVRNNNQINISKASMDNFIASFNASGLGTITQTYNPNTKQYEYTVTAPQPTEGGETV